MPCFILGASRVFLVAALLILQLQIALAQRPDSGSQEYQLKIVSSELRQTDPYKLVGPKDFLRSYEPLNPDGTINAVIEVPCGTTAKWEVNKKDGSLFWDFEDQKPRFVKYLGYPVNYGMVPRTVLTKDIGGDGDPLDVLVPGPVLPRGSVVRVKVIGVFNFVDRGERDDKLIAVIPESTFGSLNTLKDLNEQFAGITEIIAIWFQNYKGQGVTESRGFNDVEEAKKILDMTIKAFSPAASP